MSGINTGDAFPSGVTFKYVPYAEETAAVTACGIPIDYDASKEFANKKVVIVSVPGAFTPTCQASHLPGYIEHAQKLKERGVDKIIVLAYNDPWVMSAWGKANGIKDDYILFMSDPQAAFSSSIGWTLGERTARYAILLDKGKVVYAAKESGGAVDVSSAEAVMAKL